MGRLAIRCGVLLASSACLALGAATAGAQPARDGRPTPIYRCTSSAGVSYSDVRQACPGGEVTAPRAASSALVIGPQTGRVSLSGPPCPLPVPEPDGPAWAGVRACYTEVLGRQPPQRFSEPQLAGLVVGQCEADTQKLAQAGTHPDVLGSQPAERRQALRRWALWLVQQSGLASDTMPVQVVTLGRSVAIARLNGPLEVQMPDGSLIEGFNGTVVRPGQQLHVRKTVSLSLGGVAVVAQPTRDRCVRLD